MHTHKIIADRQLMIYYSGEPVNQTLHQSQCVFSLLPLQDLPDEINTKLYFLHSINIFIKF